MKTICFAIVLVFVAGFAAPRSVGQDTGLFPAPKEFSAAEQPDSPVRLSITGVRKLDGKIRNITLKIENLSGKGLLAVVTRGMEKDELNAQADWGTPLRPGYSAGLTAMSAKPIEGERVIAIDAVIFDDGTVWGEDKASNGEYYKGVRAGRTRVAADLAEHLSRNDEAALRSFVGREPHLPELSKIEKKTRFEQGFIRGYGAELVALRQAIKHRDDVGTISDHLEVLNEQLGLAPRGTGRRIAKSFSVNDILKIERVEVDGKAIELNDEFAAGDDWMRGVAVNIRNISGKRIVSFALDVRFPESTATGNVMNYSVTYGRRPGLKPEVKIAERPAIEPDGSVKISFAGDEFVRLSRFLNSRHPMSQLSRAELGFGMVHFDDGTAWSLGSLMKQDPNDPNRWIPIEKSN